MVNESPVAQGDGVSSKAARKEPPQEKTVRLIGQLTDAYLEDDDATTMVSEEPRGEATTSEKATEQGVHTPNMSPSRTLVMIDQACRVLLMSTV